MSVLTALAKAMAVAEAVAQPIATVRHVHCSDRPLVFLPLAMAGEANAPLAAMVGERRDAPRLLVVPQPRNRDQRFAFAADLASILLSYLTVMWVIWRLPLPIAPGRPGSVALTRRRSWCPISRPWPSPVCSGGRRDSGRLMGLTRFPRACPSWGSG